MCEKYDYALVELHYNNAFLVLKELNPFTPLTPEDAYIKGYLQRIDRKQRFYWNAKFEEIYSLPPEQALDFVKTFFSMILALNTPQPGRIPFSRKDDRSL